jgi:hypothetical protein
MLSKLCARPELSVFGFKLGMSVSTVMKSSIFTRPLIIRCVKASELSAAHPRVRDDTDGARFPRRFSGREGHIPTFKKRLKGATEPYDFGASCVRSGAT